MNEEQAHVQFLKDKAQSLGLTFEQYMLFLIFENIEHSPNFRRPAQNQKVRLPVRILDSSGCAVL